MGACSMKFNFSSDFVKVISPDTSFADAWETICYTLLKEEYHEKDILKLKAPENGIDIWRPQNKYAYQCKSSEIGFRGSMNITKITDSLESALSVRDTYEWCKYMICINASITGSGYQKLIEFENINSLPKSDVEVLDAEFWSELAEKHVASIEQYLDYRLLVTENEVKSAFEKARYYDKYVSQYMSAINSTPISIKLSNNRTPICIDLPFSPDLTIENLLDIAKAFFNIDMDWRQYPGLGKSAAPSISLLYNGKPQGFSKKISEVIEQGNNEFELWLKIVWRDGTDKDNTTMKKTFAGMLDLDFSINLSDVSITHPESYCQNNMWDSAISIKRNQRII